MSLLGKVALVTGSTSGIGLGVAKLLARRECALILTGLADPDHIEQITKEFNSQFKQETNFLPCDLRSKNSIKEFCRNALVLHPSGIDVLVNNAGIQHVCNIDEFPDDKWDDMLAITVSAPFHLIKNFLPAMKSKGWGRIVNISSMMGIISQEGKAPYSASKSAVIGLTRGVSLEAAPYGITCNAICPAFVNTPLIRQQIEKYGQENGIVFEEAQKKFFDKHPTKKPIEIQEVAELVGYLCSPAANNITGTSILIDGGFTIK